MPSRIFYEFCLPLIVQAVKVTELWMTYVTRQWVFQIQVVTLTTRQQIMYFTVHQWKQSTRGTNYYCQHNLDLYKLDLSYWKCYFCGKDHGKLSIRWVDKLSICWVDYCANKSTRLENSFAWLTEKY